MKVLMVGVDNSKIGGMWTVVDNYLSDPDFCNESGLTYIPVATTGSAVKRVLFTMKAMRKVKKALRTQSFEIVHLHMSEKGSVFRKGAIQRRAKRAGCRTVLHMHGAIFEDWYKACPAAIQKRVRNVLEDADRILILGEYWREFVGSLVTHPEKITVLYNAVRCPDNNRYNAGARRLLFLGAVGQRKGIDDLLEAMLKLNDSLPADVTLEIYGPDVRGDIKERITAAGLDGRVQYRGFLSPDKRDEYFCSVMLNILPSYNEGLPMTILEAMAYGIPNITTPVAAIPELIKNGKNGVMVAPGSAEEIAGAISELVANDDIRTEMSNAAFATIRKSFELKGHKKALLGIYKALSK